MVPTKRRALYKNHVNGIGTWRIWNEDNVIHFASAQVQGGAEIEHTEIVYEGKQGRSLAEQVYHRMLSRIRKQLDKGYVKTYEEAKKPVTNALGYKPPMRAQSIKRVNGIDLKSAYYQYKYNGHRCLMCHDEDGKNFAYSRQGKPQNTIRRILADVDNPYGYTIDGELYHHGTHLQTIASWVKRDQPQTNDLTYVVYDVMLDLPFIDRLEVLKHEVRFGDSVILAPTYKYGTIGIKNLLVQSKELGFEGFMLRWGNAGYQSDRRSKYLVKVKQYDGFGYEEEEFFITDIVPAEKAGWAVLVMTTWDGKKEFRASAPGPVPQKFEILENKHLYIGREAIIEFPEWTKDDVPFQPVCTGFKEYL